MTEKGKPFGSNNQPKLQPQIKKVNPQITVVLDLAINQVRTGCNFQDWDMAIGILIDALRGAHIQKMREKDRNVVIAKPLIIVPS